ncbi:hypothetical protein FRC12_008991 [Ceratobasidium sp. 428]|nr:hypothetical protein FRC12_008991 [Ceratobasidium sp. 428]
MTYEFWTDPVSRRLPINSVYSSVSTSGRRLSPSFNQPALRVQHGISSDDFRGIAAGGLASTVLPGIDGNSPVRNQYEQYGTLQPDATDALEVTFSYNSTSPKRLDVWTTNGHENNLPAFGAAMGFSTDGVDMNLGSVKYDAFVIIKV